jgi:ribosomal RNA-processing protein 9
MADDFFLQDPNLIDPDAKLSKKKRKDRMKAAASFQKKSQESDQEAWDENMDLQGSDPSSEEESDHETAAQKRLRLAKQYLGKLQEEVQDDADEVDAAQIDKDLIAERLKDDAVRHFI